VLVNCEKGTVVSLITLNGVVADPDFPNDLFWSCAGCVWDAWGEDEQRMCGMWPPATKACSGPLCISYLLSRKDDNDGHQARHEHDSQGYKAYTPPPGLAVSRPARVCHRHDG